MGKTRFLTINNPSQLDILDESIYSFDSIVFSDFSTLQSRNSNLLLTKIKQFLDSMPAIQKVSEDLQSKIEFIPRFDLIPMEAQSALKNGLAELLPCKDSDGSFYMQVRAVVDGLVIDGKEFAKNKIINIVPVSTQEIPINVYEAFMCLSTQRQFNQLTNGIRELSQVCELNFNRIIQGQRDDRLAKLLSSRSNYIQAMAITDSELQRRLLLHSIADANSARSLLAYQIKSDISQLRGKNPRTKDMSEAVSNINIAIIAINNAVELSLYSYQMLGEQSAQLAVVKEHQTFIKQVLLKEIDYKGEKIPAWSLIASSGKPGDVDGNFLSLPIKLINRCDKFIETGNEYNVEFLENENHEEK